MEFRRTAPSSGGADLVCAVVSIRAAIVLGVAFGYSSASLWSARGGQSPFLRRLQLVRTATGPDAVKKGTVPGDGLRNTTVHEAMSGDRAGTQARRRLLLRSGRRGGRAGSSRLLAGGVAGLARGRDRLVEGRNSQRQVQEAALGAQRGHAPVLRRTGATGG